MDISGDMMGPSTDVMKYHQQYDTALLEILGYGSSLYLTYESMTRENEEHHDERMEWGSRLWDKPNFLGAHNLMKRVISFSFDIYMGNIWEKMDKWGFQGNYPPHLNQTLTHHFSNKTTPKMPPEKTSKVKMKHWTPTQNHNKQHTNIYALKPPFIHFFLGNVWTCHLYIGNALHV